MLGGPIGGAPISALFDEIEVPFLDVSGESTRPAILLIGQISLEIGKSSEGSDIQVLVPAWKAIYSAISSNRELLYQFANDPRKFEEFIACAYDMAGFDEVTLTPRSGDKGRDVIAVKRGFGTIRILEQAKAYRKGHLVTNDEVSAMLGVSLTDPNCSKVILTTTADFAPSVRSADSRFALYMPYRLELRNGVELKAHLQEIMSQKVE